MTLSFKDPRAAGLYIDQYAGRSISPVEAYLWAAKPEDPSDFTVTKVERDDLDMLILEGEQDHIRLDPAVYVVGQNTEYQGNPLRSVLVMSHEAREDGEEGFWANTLLMSIPSMDALDRFIGQLIIESDFAFSE